MKYETVCKAKFDLRLINILKIDRPKIDTEDQSRSTQLMKYCEHRKRVIIDNKVVAVVTAVVVVNVGWYESTHER